MTPFYTDVSKVRQQKSSCCRGLYPGHVSCIEVIRETPRQYHLTWDWAPAALLVRGSPMAWGKRTGRQSQTLCPPTYCQVLFLTLLGLIYLVCKLHRPTVMTAQGRQWNGTTAGYMDTRPARRPPPTDPEKNMMCVCVGEGSHTSQQGRAGPLQAAG